MLLYRYSFTFLLFISIALWGTGCEKPSFPKDKVISSVKQICLNEYGLDVNVRIKGDTIGVVFEADKLISAKTGLNQEAMEHLGDILLSISRVCLSTDAEFEFFVLIAKDKTIPGFEVLFIRHVYDVKRFLLGSISRDDFFHRLLISFRFNPVINSRRAVQNFFSTLSRGMNPQVTYISEYEKDQKYLLMYNKFLMDMKIKTGINFKIEDFRIKTLPYGKVLVFCRVRETYVPKKGYGPEDFQYSSGTTNSYLMVISNNQLSPFVLAVYPLYYFNQEGVKEKLPFPDEYIKYQDLAKWPDSDFMVEDISFPQFLAEQIAQRVLREVQQIEQKRKSKKDKIDRQIDWRQDMGLLSDKKKKELSVQSKEHETKFNLTEVKGFFEIEQENGKQKQFSIDIKLKNAMEQGLADEISGITLRIANDVLNSYDYNDFHKFVINDKNTGKLLGTYDQKTVFKAR